MQIMEGEEGERGRERHETHSCGDDGSYLNNHQPRMSMFKV